MAGATKIPVPRLQGRRRPLIAVVKGISRVAPWAKPQLQKWLIRLGYQMLNRRWADVGAACLNYGYAPDAASSWTPRADLSDLPDRFGLQLYDHVAGGAPLEDRDVLEVACGRGGGAAFISRVFSVRTMTGIDFSSGAIERCRGRHVQVGLTFQQADAESLPFAHASFDAVLNVESSHCYPHIERFLDETRRVLRPGGVLLLADLRPADRIDELRTQLACRFRIVEEEDITAGVVRALTLDVARRENLIELNCPRFLRPAARDFLAIPGSQVFDHLASGRLLYRSFVLRA